MKRWKLFLPVLPLLILCGCFQVKDELVINSDGSGSAQLEVKSSFPPQFSQGLGMMGGGSGNPIYPPTSEAEAHQFFPGKDFTLTVRQENGADGGTVTHINAAFKDINALLASPYARAHALMLKLENGVLSVKELSGLEGIARMAEVKDKDGIMEFQAGLGDMEKKKNEMRGEFRLTLPNAITTSSGSREGKIANWVAERAKMTNGDAFAEQLGKVMEASCPADGIKMTPVTPPRLALMSFKDLPAGAVAATTATPDVKKIAEAAKFVPYVLQVTRSLDLSGQGGGGGEENSAQLTGAVVVPREYAPQKWGEAKLDEVTDAKGNSLKSREQEGFSGFTRRFGSSMEGDDDEADNAPVAAEERHVVTLRFQPPDWKMKEIAHIKGSVAMQYFGGFQLVKLSNSIPANWIATSEKALERGTDGSERNISDPGLPALGMTLSCQMAIVQNGMTVLSLIYGGSKANVTEVQVYDAEGKAWPTLMQESDMGEQSSAQVMVAGQPKPPLSLAMMLSSVGATAEVPIEIEHVPLTEK